ncbi:hypothetical protein SY83_00310 [Paenibacillus swuensis]|uniref:Uncharacterized protein n=1 Tax=Paenibacillus swuensis TaxID=1178515 RepID=A0A172TDH3_9BACL|nr:hypothetical protein [Paenibacillus swuensis]ANE45078.1 hypothetical protein SY83_00310 [Paenibacillus swuensis]
MKTGFVVLTLLLFLLLLFPFRQEQDHDFDDPVLGDIQTEQVDPLRPEDIEREQEEEEESIRGKVYSNTIRGSVYK